MEMCLREYFYRSLSKSNKNLIFNANFGSLLQKCDKINENRVKNAD